MLPRNDDVDKKQEQIHDCCGVKRLEELMSMEPKLGWSDLPHCERRVRWQAAGLTGHPEAEKVRWKERHGWNDAEGLLMKAPWAEVVRSSKVGLRIDPKEIEHSGIDREIAYAGVLLHAYANT